MPWLVSLIFCIPKLVAEESTRFVRFYSSKAIIPLANLQKKIRKMKIIKYLKNNGIVPTIPVSPSQKQYLHSFKIEQ